MPRQAWDKHTGKVYEESVSRRPFALSHAHAGKVKRLYLDIYASNHGGSEEFWYTTGAAYREVDLFIDECLAGAFYPFPVVYVNTSTPPHLCCAMGNTSTVCA